MKHLFFFLPLLLFSLSSKCQLDKGVWLVGGSGSFYSYHEDYTAPSVEVTGRWTSIDLSGSIGYFLVDKFSAGLRPYFSSTKGESSGGGSTNYFMLAIGPFARYYFLQADKQFNLLADVSYQLGINQRLGTLHSDGNYNVFSLMVGPEVFFNSSVGLEILLGYSQKKMSINNSPDQFNSNKKGFQVSAGFQIHLQKN